MLTTMFVKTLLRRSLKQQLHDTARTETQYFETGTSEFVDYRVLNDYIQDTSHQTVVHARIMYNSRVDAISKRASDWNLRTSTIAENDGVAQRTLQDWVRCWTPLVETWWPVPGRNSTSF